MVPRISAKAIPTIIILGLMLSSCASVEDAIFDMGIRAARKQSGFVSKRIRAGDHDIAYLERGGKGETIVLLHGFAATKDNWLLFARHVPKAYRVLAMDLPGHGDSSMFFDQSYDAEQITRCLAVAFENLNIGRFHLTGNSFGGYIATLYAAQYPEKIITLGLMDSAGVRSPTPSEFDLLLEKGDNPLVFDTEQGFERMTDFVFFHKPFMPWPSESAAARRYRKRGAAHKKIWEDIWSHRKEVNDILPKLDMPVFLLWGEKDRVLHVSGIEIYKQFLPHVSIVVSKDCGHTPMIEKPAETAAEYSKFVISSSIR